jgi:uncharacterized protein with PQ loop repeat
LTFIKRNDRKQIDLCEKFSKMNTFIWFLQSILAFIFLFSGINKSIYSEKTLVAKGQTGVEGLPLSLIRLIGISEILGAIGLIAPYLLHIYPVLTNIAAISMGLIMIPAAIIHYKRKEYKNVGLNCLIFIVSFLVAFLR